MKKTVGLLLAAALACAVMNPVGAASLTLTSSSSGDLTLAQALADASATVADLTGNVYDDIVVAGNGRILFDADIRAYTGTVHVLSGAQAVVREVCGLGATNGIVYVADGGALISDATGFAAETFTMEKSEIHLAGSGPSGAGALVGKANTSQRGGIWGKNGKIVLESDALISSQVGSGVVVDFPMQSPSTSVVNMDLQGHTLTLAPHGTYLPVRMMIANPGNIVVTNANLSVNDSNVFGTSADNRLILRNGGTIHLFNRTKPIHWTLEYDTAASLRPEQRSSRWDGPIELKRHMTVTSVTYKQNDVYYNPELSLYGPIRGDWGISIVSGSPSKHSNHLWLYSPDSTFTGGIVVNDNTYLHVMTNGAVPVAGGPIVVSNAFLDVQAGSCVLPSVDCFCSGACVIPDTGVSPGRIAGTLTKRGGGTLDCAWLSSKDGIDLKAGTLKLASGADAWYAGVYEGDRSLGWSGTGQTSEWGSPLWYAITPVRDRSQKSMRWVMSASSFPKGGCTVYEGWIYCPASEVGKWRFASNVIGLGRLRIDGAEIINKQDLKKVCFGTATMTEGWHHIMFRMGRTGVDGGPNTSLNGACEYNQNTAISMDAEMLAAWQASELGLSICKDSAKAEAKTTNIVDFAAFPSDPGDGSVLRFVQPGSAEEAALAEAFTNRQMVGFLVAATNTVLDLRGAPLAVGSVTGFPTVVHTDIPAWLAGSTPNLTVTNSWTVSAEGLASGAAFTVTGGALTFAEGATLRVPDSRALPDTRGGSLAVATATGGIAGLPELVFAEGDRRGILRKSDDGKSLLLTVASGMMVIFR